MRYFDDGVNRGGDHRQKLRGEFARGLRGHWSRRGRLAGELFDQAAEFGDFGLQLFKPANKRLHKVGRFIFGMFFHGSRCVVSKSHGTAQSRRPARYSILKRACPSSTPSPTLTLIAVTLPDLAALTYVFIFIASMVTT